MICVCIYKNFFIDRVPACVLLSHIVCILLYDLDSPTGMRKWSPVLQAIGLHLIILGVLQSITAFFTATIVCPVLAASILLCKYTVLVLCMYKDELSVVVFFIKSVTDDAYHMNIDNL